MGNGKVIYKMILSFLEINFGEKIYTLPHRLSYTLDK